MRTVLEGLRLGLALCLCWAGCAAAESRTVFVVDATAQMNAKLGQQRKMDAMKSAVSAAAARLDTSAQVALWAFGTNPARKCEDRGALVPLQPAETAAGAIDKALSPMQPKAARAPIFDTLHAALAALGEPKDAAASAVLIAGTGDDCTGDICSEAKRLHVTYPNAKLTVLGIGMSDQAAANFTCAAKEMGGAFTAVKSGTDLDRMLRQTLDIAPNAKPARGPGQASSAPAAPEGGADKRPPANAAAAAPEAPGSEKPAEVQPAVKAEAPQPQPEANTVLSAVMANGMPPLDEGVTWEIYKINTTPTGQLRMAEVPSWTGGGGQAKVKLADGRYAVQVAYGFATATGEFTAGASKTEKTIALDAGTIGAEALQAPGSEPAGGAFFALYRRKSPAALELLGRSSETPAIFHVNAGDYVLTASAGAAKLDTTVKVQAGKISVVRMALNTGTLDIKTFAAEGASKPVTAWHEIYPAASQPGQQPLLRIAGGAHRVELPAGSYRLVTAYGDARVETAVTVMAGQTVPLAIAVNAGEAKIALPAGKPPQVCAVYDTGTARNAGAVARAAGTGMKFTLRAGTYDVECRAPNAATPAKQTQIKVVAGETKEVKIEE